MGTTHRSGLARSRGAQALASGSLCALAGAVALGVGCGSGSHGSGGTFASIAASTSSTGASASPAPSPRGPGAPPAGLGTVPVSNVVPLVLVHGITGSPADFDRFRELYGVGRERVPQLFAAEADRLSPGDLPRAVVVGAGYYQESQSTPRYDPDPSGRGTDSIGGCPSPRLDIYAGDYTHSYAERLARIVDGVRRATGSDRVDLACHSMGNIVSRAYILWHSDGAAGGTSKVRRYFSIVGPHRGINAIEAFSFGFVQPPQRAFMHQGEIAEMCYEYPDWSGQSFVDRLNGGWDAYCSSADVHYGGVSSIGPHGYQANPNGGHQVSTTVVAGVQQALQSFGHGSVGDLTPFWLIAAPNVLSESVEALGPGDQVVRLASSRLDRAPFARADFWGPFECRHDGVWDPEQSMVSCTMTVEIARQYFEGTLSTAATVSSASLVLEDSPGHASWLALETSAQGGDLAGAQIVEEVLDANGNPVGGATGYGVVVHEGDQRAFVPIPAGGGDRRYRLVVYGPDGPLLPPSDVTLHLTDGALDAAPTTSFVAATPTPTRSGSASVQASFGSNAAPGDATLAFSFRLDGGAWTAWSASATFDTGTLGPGEHRLEARARHSTNGAGVLTEDSRGTAVGLFLDASGNLTVRR